MHPVSPRQGRRRHRQPQAESQAAMRWERRAGPNRTRSSGIPHSCLPHRFLRPRPGTQRAINLRRMSLRYSSCCTNCVRSCVSTRVGSMLSASHSAVMAPGTFLAIHPDLFAAAVPLCGGGDPRRILSARNVAVWAFHGAKDATVPVARSREMVAALRTVNSSVKYHRVIRTWATMCGPAHSGSTICRTGCSRSDDAERFICGRRWNCNDATLVASVSDCCSPGTQRWKVRQP